MSSHTTNFWLTSCLNYCTIFNVQSNKDTKVPNSTFVKDLFLGANSEKQFTNIVITESKYSCRPKTLSIKKREVEISGASFPFSVKDYSSLIVRNLAQAFPSFEKKNYIAIFIFFKIPKQINFQNT